MTDIQELDEINELMSSLCGYEIANDMYMARKSLTNFGGFNIRTIKELYRYNELNPVGEMIYFIRWIYTKRFKCFTGDYACDPYWEEKEKIVNIPYFKGEYRDLDFHNVFLFLKKINREFEIINKDRILVLNPEIYYD